jgi:phospholipid N-methyltransferase
MFFHPVINVFFCGLSMNSAPDAAAAASTPSFDRRNTLTREEARQVYDKYAEKTDLRSGQDAASGYGGPAVSALLNMADFDSATKVLEYGTGQGKLAELVLNSNPDSSLFWQGIDQSPNMVKGFQQRCVATFGPERCAIDFLESGNPSDVKVEPGTYDRFVSTYVLDLMSEEDMYKVLDLAETSLCPDKGMLLLAGITWGYTKSIRTFYTTLVWEFMYQIRRKKVGGCRPQALQPYLKARGWRIEKVETTLPVGYPWMASEVICARPPLAKSDGK